MTVSTMRPYGSMRNGLVALAESLLPENAVVAEVGSFAGESAEIFLRTGRVWFMVCVDPFDDEHASDIVKHVDHRGVTMSEVKAAFEDRILGTGLASRVWNPPGWTSEQAAAAMSEQGRKFDLVYIDGRHEYKNVKRDLELWSPLVKPGGWLAGHDWMMDDVKRAVREVCGEPTNFYEDFSWAIKRGA
jgi:predicted O-methyltransferase YrrM